MIVIIDHILCHMNIKEKILYYYIVADFTLV